MSQMFFCQCEVCGSRFLSKKEGANVCIKKSSCRVKLSRMKKKLQTEAQKMVLDMETYALYQEVIRVNPAIETSLSLMLAQFGKEAFDLMLSGVSAAMLGTQR